jgi:diguanylate cyclase (GGDEF)-like protein
VVAERLRQAVEHTQVPWNPPLPRVTISLGVSVYNSYLKLGANELIEQADEALYISKKRGRNRTTVWGSGLLFKGQRLREKKSS